MTLELQDTEERDRVERTLAAVEQRGFHTVFVPDRKAALDTLLGMIPKGASVAHGTSTTLQQIGFVDYLKRPDSVYHYLNPEWQAENDATLRNRLRGKLSLGSDYFLGSVQAICETGEVIGADAGGSRQAFYVFGPPHVIWVAGINKLVTTIEEGIKRVREIALPQEDQRMKRTGAPGSFVGKMVIYARAGPP